MQGRKTPHIAPGLEAFAHLAIANNHAKWPHVMKCKKENRISGKICIVESVDTDKLQSSPGTRGEKVAKQLPIKMGVPKAN